MAGKYLPPASLTPSGRPVLFSGETECSLLSNVDLLSEDNNNNNNFPHLKSGTVILTTHRLLWISPDATSASSVPLSTVVHVFTSRKSIKSMFASPRIRFQVSTNNEGGVDGSCSRSSVITLVSRGKSDLDPFLEKFSEVLKGRAWENSIPSGSGSGSGVGPSGGGGSLAIKMPMVGVSGILRKEQEMWESTDKSLQDAFQDLNALMSKAKEMVLLAEKMRQKLLSGSNNTASSANDEEMASKEDMQDWLLSVGVVSPVTKESAGALYHQQLSRQILSKSL